MPPLKTMDYEPHLAPPVPPHNSNETGHSVGQERSLKCVLLGDGAVGKTSLVVSYTTNGYPTKYVPTAFDDFSAVVQVDGNPVRLQFRDTAGQNVWEKWVPEIRRHCPLTPVVLVGTQCDLRQDVKVLIELNRRQEKPVPEGNARALAEKIGAIAYVECSALTQKNLKEVFDVAISNGLSFSERRACKERKMKNTADKMKMLSKSWWKKYACLQ
ncbi:Rho-related GTP-binding protein RhoU [Acipenser ruthenus]|uniref:Rho-related GTP-binding protein RhoU n=1 Tax=Acipenser ruthenus TaxID=7906 RepID=A0A444TX81_ACIRT|nr:Rho-related GTP-binding protein RhoU [Acipenser ruthenus]